MTTTTATQNYRKNAEAVRRLTINPAPTSRPNYRNNQIAYCEQQVARYEQMIMDANPELAGMLKDERNLMDRIYAARGTGVGRPELKARLKVTRNQINKEVK